MKLETLSLGSNRLSGHLPTRVCFSGSLLFFSVNNNSFSGPVPSTIQNCSKLIRLRFEGNQITGNVTDALSYNGLTGGLPQQFGSLKMLETLNISHNNFTGSIPTTFNDLFSLTMIDISYNQLEGRVPDMRVFQQAPFKAIENNKGLCGNITGLKDCPRTHVNEKTKNSQGLMILILDPTICLVLILIMIVGILIFLRRTKKKETEPPKPVNHPPFAIWSYDGKMMYETIIDVVDDFDSKHVIGVGGCGIVYRAELPTSEPIAIKKFNTQEPDEWVDFKSFENEVRALTGTRHHNIVRLL
ncbi:putative protein kinase RLK-Pelle-LRR-XI-1 family [Helianthus annuus]|nr:putative protein kinase RLK-Pelle-LRR-XI-1 family [Helianthus annuus]